MYKLLFLLLSCFCIFAYVHHTMEDRSIKPAVQYFPIDQKAKFTNASTSLKKIDFKRLLWTVESTLNKEAYLRQDIGLLFENGRLIGVMNKWQSPGRQLYQDASKQLNERSLVEAVSYHHAELHDDQISSAGKMSSIKTYVSPAHELFSFPKNDQELETKKNAVTQTENLLKKNWNQALQTLQIKEENYIAVPLTKLPEYPADTLPGLKDPNTASRIISQLWEGLYKNYVLPAGSALESNSVIESYVPLLLFDKAGNHVLVVYQDENGKAQSLIQLY